MEPEHFGPYRLDGLLGRGGMGEVHRAFDTVKRRTVALKRLRRDLADDPGFQRRFRRESEHAARLSDPHVIPIHDYGEIDGVLYIDMRFVQGTDFAALLGEQGPLPAARAVHLVAQVASALDAAHADGLVHRDVKPSNALTTGADRDDFVYLVDFGIVASTTPGTASLTATGATVGTLEYMAPERFDEGPHDHRVDVYALGCVLYELLTGEKAFPAQSFATLLKAHLHGPPPRPTAVRPDLPVGFDRVVARALAKNPDDRFASAGDLARAARACLATRPVPPTLPPRRPVAPPAQTERPWWVERSATLPGVAGPTPAAMAAPAGRLQAGRARIAAPAAAGRTGRRRRTVRALLGALAVVCVVAGGGVLGGTWVLQQYYVGAADGRVAIFQGVRGNVLGLPLQRAAELTDIALTDLPETARISVEDGLLVPEGGLDGARERVAMLRGSVLAPCPAPVRQTAPPPAATRGPLLYPSAVEPGIGLPTPLPGPDTTPLPTVAPEPGLPCRPDS